ncbi:hypothetical protein F511_29599 [Dorcoceras hygrometricum]|uniref:Uncharacterized protein n=1 Tax=Dorcoceras hygrometricum TaxID=472368 RepID=A0A2Z7AER3_9LAMI|nr:hypothetical protein F511_29599 [Dorcoceras hygrometricum]
MHSRDRPPTFASHSLLQPPLAGAPSAGPPPGSAGPNLTDPIPNHGRLDAQSLGSRRIAQATNTHCTVFLNLRSVRP